MIEKQYSQSSFGLKVANQSIVILMIVVGAGLLLIGYFWLIKPKMDDMAAQSAQIISSEDQQTKNKTFLESLKTLEQEYNQIRDQRRVDLDRLTKLLPSDPQIAELFSLSDRLAVANGFEIKSIDFSGEFADNDDKTAQVTTPETAGEPIVDNGLRQIIMHIVVGTIVDEDDEPISGRSAYQSFKQYLTALETNLRLMDITTLTFNALEEGEKPGSETFNFDIITYYRQDE